MTVEEKRQMIFKNAKYCKTPKSTWNLLDTIQLIWIVNKVEKRGNANIPKIRPMVRRVLKETMKYSIDFIHSSSEANYIVSRK